MGIPTETTSFATSGSARTRRSRASRTASGVDSQTAFMFGKARRSRWASKRSFELRGGPSISKATLCTPCSFSISFSRSSAQWRRMPAR